MAYPNHHLVRRSWKRPPSHLDVPAAIHPEPDTVSSGDDASGRFPKRTPLDKRPHRGVPRGNGPSTTSIEFSARREAGGDSVPKVRRAYGSDRLHPDISDCVGADRPGQLKTHFTHFPRKGGETLVSPPYRKPHGKDAVKINT